MDVFVYRSTKKTGFYVYLPKKNDFSAIPAALSQALGKLEYSMEFDLHPARKLASEDPQKVLDNIEELGFHLQITDPLATPDIFKLR